MNCDLCGGKMEETKKRYFLELDHQVVIVERVPCRSCSQCGERLFAPEVVEQLHAMLHGGRSKRVATVNTPVYEYSPQAARRTRREGGDDATPRSRDFVPGYDIEPSGALVPTPDFHGAQFQAGRQENVNAPASRCFPA